MNKAQVTRHRNLLKKTVESAFSDWDGDFKVAVKHDPDYSDECDTNYFYVDITHVRMSGVSIEFTARVRNDQIEFDWYDDCWQDLTPLSLFQFMFFEMAEGISVLSTKTSGK